MNPVSEKDKESNKNSVASEKKEENIILNKKNEEKRQM